MTQDEIIEMAKEAGLEVDGVFFSDHMYREVLVRFAKLVATKEREDLAQPEQEPVAWQWLDTAHFRKKLPKDAGDGVWNPLYAAPQRTFVGLTDEEIEQLHTAWVLGGGFRQLCNAIEAKLKEKNGYAEDKNT